MTNIITSPGEYRTRNGWKATIVAIKDNWAIGWIDDIAIGQTWRASGKYKNTHPDVSTDLDITGPFVPPRKRAPDKIWLRFTNPMTDPPCVTTVFTTFDHTAHEYRLIDPEAEKEARECVQQVLFEVRKYNDDWAKKLDRALSLLFPDEAQ